MELTAEQIDTIISAVEKIALAFGGVLLGFLLNSIKNKFSNNISRKARLKGLLHCYCGLVNNYRILWLERDYHQMNFLLNDNKEIEMELFLSANNFIYVYLEKLFNIEKDIVNCMREFKANDNYINAFDVIDDYVNETDEMMQSCSLNELHEKYNCIIDGMSKSNKEYEKRFYSSFEKFL